MNRREFNRSLLCGTVALAIPARPIRQSVLRVDGARISRQLAALSEFGKNPGEIGRAHV